MRDEGTTRKNLAGPMIVVACCLVALAGIATSDLGENQPSKIRFAHVDRDCRAVYGKGFKLAQGETDTSASAAPRPDKGLVSREPDFKTCIVRATDHRHEPPEGFARSDYSRRQAFNADDSYFLAYAKGGAWHLYNADSLTYVRMLRGPVGDAEPQWHPRVARLLYYLPARGGMQVMLHDVETNRSEVAADFTGKLPWPKASRVWTRGEGSPSADGRTWCFLAESAEGKVLGAFSYDLEDQRVLGSLDLAAAPDHISTSPSGRYCVVAGDTGGTVAWDLRFSASRKLLRSSQHSDIAVGPDGDDVFVFIDFDGDGELVMVNLDTGKRVALLDTYLGGATTAMHVSGKAYELPGWVVISTYASTGAKKWLHGRVLAVELKEMPRIVSLARHHSHYDGYWTQPQATTNRKLTRILFNSNWGSKSSTDVDVYMIRLPDDGLASTRTRTRARPPFNQAARFAAGMD